MKRLIPILIVSLAFAGCIDKSGLSANSSRTQHPATNANAAVVVQEYADFQCPACRAAHEYLTKSLVQKYGNQIRFEFKHFPLSSIHQFAMPAAEASECSADQGKFWEFVDHDYTNQEKLNNAALDTWGADLKLDTALYNRCRRSHIKRKTIQADYEAGKALGVNSTPTFSVNGVLIPSDKNTMEDISAAIDAALANTAKNL